MCVCVFFFGGGGGGALVGEKASWMIHHTLGDVSGAARGSHLSSELPVSRHDFNQLSMLLFTSACLFIAAVLPDNL